MRRGALGVAWFGGCGVAHMVWRDVSWRGLAFQQRGYDSEVEVPLDRLVSTQFHLTKTELRAVRRLDAFFAFFPFPSFLPFFLFSMFFFLFLGGVDRGPKGVRVLDPRGVI